MSIARAENSCAAVATQVRNVSALGVLSAVPLTGSVILTSFSRAAIPDACGLTRGGKKHRNERPLHRSQLRL